MHFVELLYHYGYDYDPRKIYFCSYGKYELGSAQDPPVQCDFWALHVGLVGALYFQYPLY